MKHSRWFSSLLAIILILSIPLAVNAAPPTTIYDVINTSDYGSSDPVIVGSLRWAMTQANTDSGPSRITFNINTTTDPGCTSGGPCTIQPEWALPFLNVGNTEIDGYSHPLADPAVGSTPADIVIVIDGTSVTGNHGFNVTSSDNVIKGLAIRSFGYYGIAIYETGPESDNNVIEGNYIGTNHTGLTCHGNGGELFLSVPFGGGIGIEGGAANNIIGGTTPAQRNIIACNNLNGIDIADVTNTLSVTGNQVLGNYIGDWSLDAPDQGNDDTGVFIGHGAFDNTVGGSTAGARNVINGNGGDGIQMYGPNTTGNVIAGNYIGVNGDATVDVGNSNAGINIIGGAHGNTVGGATSAERNIISGNSNSGVRLAGPATHDNDITGNYIGTRATGGIAIGNAIAGVLIEDQAWGNTIGPVNLISGNYGPGILLKGTATFNIVKTNFIGTNAAGDAALQNYYGVQIDDGANNNLIGGISMGDANLISGNQFDGVEITGTGTDSNVILSNSIGTNLSGSAAVANGGGVRITDAAQDNHVGQPTSSNLISGNTYTGVWISGTGTSGNVVSGNVIGVNGAGTVALANDVGVSIALGAQDNTLGGSTTSAGNVISGNSLDGVRLWDAATTGNTISGNHIGVDAAGTAAIPNGDDGVVINGGAHHNVIGGDTTLERNIISGNSEYGVFMEDSGTDSNQVLGNFIGTDSTGMSALPNGNSGVILQNGPELNVIGGGSPAEGNVISGNDDHGVYLYGSGTDSNTISGNIIGLIATGSGALANGRNGIVILDGPQTSMVGGTSAGERNIISGNDEDGVYISGASSNTVKGNYIGTDAQGSSGIGNGYRGIRIWNASSDNTIGPGNRIAFNGFRGVSVDGASSVGNVITQNSIYSNTIGGIGLFSGAHNSISAPSISTTYMSSVTIEGTACSGCKVEVFSNPDTEGQGKTYLGFTVATGGSWSLTVPCISGIYLTATATDGTDGTSEFSSVFTSTVHCTFLPLIMR